MGLISRIVEGADGKNSRAGPVRQERRASRARSTSRGRITAIRRGRRRHRGGGDGAVPPQHRHVVDQTYVIDTTSIPTNRCSGSASSRRQACGCRHPTGTKFIHAEFQSADRNRAVSESPPRRRRPSRPRDLVLRADYHQIRAEHTERVWRIPAAVRGASSTRPTASCFLA